MGGVKGRMEDMLPVPPAPAAGSALCSAAPRARSAASHRAALPGPARPLPAPPLPQRRGPAAPNFARSSPPLPGGGGGGGSSLLLLPLLPRSVCAERRPLQLIPSLSLMQIACWPPRPGFHPLLPSQTRRRGREGGWKEGGEAAGPPGAPRLHRRPRRPRLPQGDRAARGPQRGHKEEEKQGKRAWRGARTNPTDRKIKCKAPQVHSPLSEGRGHGTAAAPAEGISCMVRSHTDT